MFTQDKDSKNNIPDGPLSFPRPRLYEMLDRHRHVKLLTVEAEPGYGKTALLSGYIANRGLPALWHPLRESDQCPGVFASRLQASLERLRKPPPADSHPPNPARGLEELLHTLADWQDELYIVLDNAQLIQGIPDVLPPVERLLRESPPGIRFVLIGQTLPDLPYSSFKLRQNYYHIDKTALALAPDEIAEIFRRTLPSPLADHEVEYLHRETEGWAAGLELIRDAIQHQPAEERQRILVKLPDIPHLYAYLLTEVLQSLTPSIRSFLLRTSIMKRMEPDVVRHYLDVTDEALPDPLNTRFPFTIRSCGHGYRYHTLFRSFLLGSYRRETSRSDINRDHLRLSRIYESKHLFFPAFAHSILGRDFVNAGRLMRILQVRYQPEEFLELLEGWLEEFFDHHYIESSIFLYRCIPLYMLNRLIERLERNLADLEQRGQRLWAAKVRQQLAGIYKLIGNLDRARQLSEEALHTFERLLVLPMVMLALNFQADLLLNQGQAPEAMSRARRCLFLAESERQAHFLPYALSGIADAMIEVGAPEAADYLEQAMELSGDNDDALKFFLYCSKCKLYNWIRDIPRAIEWAQKTVALADDFGFERDIGIANVYLARAYMSAGRLQEASSCLDISYRIVRPYTFIFAYVVVAQYRLLLRQERADAARAKRLELESICGQFGYPFIIGRYGQEPEKAPPAIVVERTPTLLEIKALGPLSITYDSKPVHVKRKASLRLLLNLIVNHRIRRPQELIIEELFPEQLPSAAKNQLYVALSVLRSALDPEADSGRKCRFVKNDEGLYSLNTAMVELDVAQFCEVDRNSADIGELVRAEQLYRGDLLEEYRYESFIDSERECLRLKYLHMLSKLAEHFAGQGEHYRSMECYEKLCAKDPYNPKNYQAYAAMLKSFRLDGHARNVEEQWQRLAREWTE
ncbi:BTAD domain-containing putative transcriptional regulator [Paenibacillus sp. GCM10023250]|uniref:BTAD domain-containing putative transcriptional regulator n=1 Tax=Paenibacillus sp. GCM10023250 TaxID=3252648 RepID=UPI0036110935